MTKFFFGVTLIFTIFNNTVKYDSYLEDFLNFDDTKYRGGKINLICSANDLSYRKQIKDYRG